MANYDNVVIKQRLFTNTRILYLSDDTHDFDFR